MVDGEREHVGKAERLAATSQSVTTKVGGWVKGHENVDDLVNVASSLYKRDRDMYSSVLGSAVAYRLFLFIVPTNVALVSLVRLFNFGPKVTDRIKNAPMTREFADKVLSFSHSRALWVFVTMLALAVWSGRSLARALSTCAASSWGLGAAATKLKGRQLIWASLMGVLLVFISDALNRLRSTEAITVTVGVVLTTCLTIGACWFVVELAMPRGSSDPGALLPGALLLGLVLGVFEWFASIYLPARIRREEQIYGSFASALANLTLMFILGRMMVVSNVVNVMVYERYGSFSRFFFGLPVMRKIPERFPRVSTYFALEGSTHDVMAARIEELEAEVAGE